MSTVNDTRTTRKDKEREVAEEYAKKFLGGCKIHLDFSIIRKLFVRLIEGAIFSLINAGNFWFLSSDSH